MRRLYAILKSVAPETEAAIKWGTPFFVEPRFLFSFSAHKAHCNFAPTEAALEVFRKELEKHRTTKNYLQIPYDEPVPEDLIARSPSTVSGLCVNVKTTLSGNSIPVGMDGL